MKQDSEATTACKLLGLFIVSITIVMAGCLDWSARRDGGSSDEPHDADRADVVTEPDADALLDADTPSDADDPGDTGEIPDAHDADSLDESQLADHDDDDDDDIDESLDADDELPVTCQEVVWCMFQCQATDDACILNCLLYTCSPAYMAASEVSDCAQAHCRAVCFGSGDAECEDCLIESCTDEWSTCRRVTCG